MTTIKKLLRINRRMVHRAHQIVFPIGVLIIGIFGIVITDTEDKVLNLSVDLSSIPTMLGYVLTWGAIIAVLGTTIELLRKVIPVVRTRLKLTKKTTLRQRIDDVSN